MIESVGLSFDPEELHNTQNITKSIVTDLFSQLELGMTEDDAHGVLKTIFFKYKIEKLWHPSKIRFGQNTLKAFREKSDPVISLLENDILFADIGPVINGYEGDFGKTIVFGEKLIHCNFAKSSEVIFNEVSSYWRNTGSTGEELYKYASQCANDKGYELNLSMKGHRISDFPHAIYYKGGMDSVAQQIKTDLWVLEILVYCPKLNRNSFFEDILSY